MNTRDVRTAIKYHGDVVRKIEEIITMQDGCVFDIEPTDFIEIISVEVGNADVLANIQTYNGTEEISIPLKVIASGSEKLIAKWADPLIARTVRQRQEIKEEEAADVVGSIKRVIEDLVIEHNIASIHATSEKVNLVFKKSCH